jgi:hypothetical protein
MIPRIFSYLAICALLVNAETSAAHYTGVYVNPDYGFSITIPSGYVGLGAAENAPNHGFLIRIADNTVISVSASYDADAGVPGEGWVQQMIRLHGAPTQTLDGLRAWRILTRRDSSRTETITARRIKGTDVPIIYSMSLETSAPNVSRSAGLFQEVVKSFRVRQIGQ